MHAQHIGYLRFDALHRIQRGHRILRNERNFASEQRAALRLRKMRDRAPVEHDAAVRDPGVGRRDTEHDPAYHGFARAGFAHEPDNLSGTDLQGYPPQKAQRGPHVKAQIQVTDIEQRIHRLCTGSIASRNPSPSALSPSTATIMQLIGAAISHQAWFTYS